MRVFLDVGAHTGETAIAVLDERYRFDRIVCFEPASACWPTLHGVTDPRIEVCEFGLSNETCTRVLYRAGSLDATVFSDMSDATGSTESETATFVRASEWFARNVSADDVVFLKLNCEGSEVAIVEDLLESGELPKAYSVMIDFDVRKVPSLRSRELSLRRRLRAGGHDNVAFAEDVMIGTTHADRIRSWLDSVGGTEDLGLDALREKYGSRLAWLSSRRGHGARLEEALRSAVLPRLPAPVEASAKAVWRARRRLSQRYRKHRLERGVGGDS